METELILSGMGFPPLTARGCTQSLIPLIPGELRRTINGQLHYLGRETHHKYKSRIECSDQNPAGLNRLWVGSALTVCCIQTIVQVVLPSHHDGPIALVRPARDDSIQVMDELQQPVAFQVGPNHTLHLQNTEREKEVFILFQPILHMRLTDFSLHTQEWGNCGKWWLTLEEI
jgi:hypothetical protein